MQLFDGTSKQIENTKNKVDDIFGAPSDAYPNCEAIEKYASRHYAQGDNKLSADMFEAGHFVFGSGKPNNVDGALANYVRTKQPIEISSDKVYNIALQKPTGVSATYVFMYGKSENGIGEYKGYFTLRNDKLIRPILNIVNGAAMSYQDKGTIATGVNYINISVEQTDATNLPVMMWESNEIEKKYIEWLKPNEKPKTYYSTEKQLLSKSQKDDVTLARDKARFDGCFNYIAYSEVTDSDYSINSKEHFEWAATQRFTALKGDVQPTADDELIMCHDEGFTFTSGEIASEFDKTNYTPIISKTKAECLAYKHTRTGNSVCDFDTFVKICKKNGKIPYITIRDEHIEDIVVPKMLETLDKYNMRKNCIVNSFTYDTLKTVRKFDDNIMLSQVIKGGVLFSQEHISNAINLGVSLICGTNSSNKWEALETEAVQKIIKLAKYYDIRLYEALVEDASVIDKLMEYGISGAQMKTVPIF